MAMKIPVMLTPKQVAFLVNLPSMGMEGNEALKAAFQKALSNHQSKVRSAENLLARIRDEE